ncbi:TetR/AcrR family transcriptional regulator [Phenylobacterium aquaticum]|uniref:TetR/AcrR family transcriptional regulator n=1 Tax=Phenylobacterium aquaticum TaxID=1763816 RepID=UPI001F5C5289|nr:TetR/AcrR family transcriptional regulator [Phenylobacterium aquaticum]MCI3131038.1 TetR/AcrR family transcriptional regulator [Phenylobacterium aquaticum]
MTQASLTRPKGDKRARTRAALLAAARELIREQGYERTTLDAVAKRAGMTSGAIYGNFKNREDLFMALTEVHWAPIKPVIRTGSSFAEKMRALSEATIAAIPERQDAAYGRLTGMAYALTHEQIRARVREVTAQNFAAGASWLRAVADEGGLPMPADLLVCVIHALTEGLLFQRFLTPELVPDEAFHAAFAALAGAPPGE